MKYWVGVQGNKREVFRRRETPTLASHGHLYAAVIGPFYTKRGAVVMAGAHNNPHIQCVADAERIAKEMYGREKEAENRA